MGPVGARPTPAPAIAAGLAVLRLGVCVGLGGCQPPGSGDDAGPAETATAAVSATSGPAIAPSGAGSTGRDAAAGAASSAGGLADRATSRASAVAAPESGACPADMELVEGNYCPGAAQKCLEVHKEYENAEKRREHKRAEGEAEERMTASERCLRYAEPSVCVSKKRRAMRFCMDR